MGYIYETQYDSPNYTNGRAGSRIKGITIHHWGVDGQKHDDVVRYLCRSNGNSSAHYIVSSGRVTCIIAPSHTAWHAGNWAANLTQIGIECRPECTPQDRETVAELIAHLYKTYGYLPLSPHKKWCATACPGRWEAWLGWLEKRAKEILAGTPAKTSGNAKPKKETNLQKDEETMNTGVFWKRKSDGAIVCAVLNTQSGFFARYTNGKTRLSAYDNPLAIAFNTPTWAEITESHANVLQAQCAEIRGKKG